MSVFLILCAYVIACVGLGGLCARFLLDDRSGGKLSLKFGIGSTLLSGVWILIGLKGLLLSSVICVTILPLFLLGLFELRSLKAAVAKPDLSPASLLLWIAIAAVTAALLWHGVLAYLRPPFGDADAFYMTYPKIMAETGRLSAMLFVYYDFSTVGLLGEMHFAVLMVIASAPAAKLFAWIAGIAIVFVMVEVTGKLGGGRIAKILVAAALATSPTVTDYLSDGKTELFGALSALAVVASIIIWPASLHTKRGIFLVGALSAIMAYAKFSYILCMLPTVVVLSLLMFKPEGEAGCLKSLSRQILFGAAGFAVGLLPHLIKNWILFGNAAAPFLGMKENWADQASWFSFADTAWIIGTLPFSLVLGNYPLMGGTLSMIWLVALPFSAYLLFAGKAMKGNRLLQVTVCAMIGLACWLVVKPSIFAPRYFLPNLLLLLPLPFIGVERYVTSGKASRMVLGLLGTLAAFVTAVSPGEPPAGVWTATPHMVSEYIKNGRPECGLSISDYCRIFGIVNKNIPVGRRMFVLGYYTYWIEGSLLRRINTNEETLSVSKQPENIWQYLHDHGFCAVAVQTATHGNYVPYLQKAKLPEGFKVVEDFKGSNMPVFFLHKDGETETCPSGQ